MSTSYTSAKALVLALLVVCALAGCCCHAVPCLPDEKHCPTDARRLYWTFGEEAVRRCPCGPDREFYGLKPTQWRSWPEGWRSNDSPWGEPILAEPESAYAESSEKGSAEEPSAAIELELGEMVPNPFRHVAERQPPTSDNTSPAKLDEKSEPDADVTPAAETSAKPKTTKTPPAAPAAQPVTANPPAVPATPTFEPAPLINLPAMNQALSNIQASAPVFPKTDPTPVAKQPEPTTPAASDLDATPARGVPHVDKSLSGRVGQHLLDNLTL